MRKHKKRYSYLVSLVALAAGVVAWFVEPAGWVAAVIVAFGLGYTMMWYAIPNILAACYRKRLYDLPGGRHIHTSPIPKLGGWTFAPIVCCTVILTLALHRLVAPGSHEAAPECGMWICALIFIHMAGTIDDLVGVRHSVKIVIQSVAALLVVASGWWINDLGGFVGIHTIPAGVGIPLTIVFIVGLINAISVLDGIDGLASGLCIVILTIYGVVFAATGRWFFAIVAFSGVGVLVPFLYTNMRGVGRRRRRLFMGDTGSQAMGLIIGVLAVAQMMNTGTVFADSSFAVALSPLVVPVFDAVHVVIVRLFRGIPLLGPDLLHLHYRLLDKGMNQREALAAILCLSVVVVAVNAALAPHIGVSWILLLDAAIWGLFNSKVLTVTITGLRQRDAVRKE